MNSDDSTPKSPPLDSSPAFSMTETMRGIFDTNNRSLANMAQAKTFSSSKKRGKSTQELEFALTMILVEIANAGGSFTQREFTVVSGCIKSIFGTELSEAYTLINQALGALQHLRGASKYAEVLKTSLNSQVHKKILQCIDNVMQRENCEPQGFEIYIRDKYLKIFSA